MNVSVIIPAAGRSRRFGDSDKLLQDLGGRPLLIRTVEAFTKRDEVQSIIVAGPPDGMEQFRERFGATLGFHGAVVVAGGRSCRAETVKLAIDAVPADATHIAVHDAARPGVGKDVLERVFGAARSRSAVVPVVDISATVKRLSDESVDVAAGEDDAAVLDAILGGEGRLSIDARTVVETVDRHGLVEVQTPQVFEADLLRRAYAQEGIEEATDDAMLVERLGETVHAVAGDVRNLKVTSPADLALMRAVLGVRSPAQRPVHKRF